MKKYIIILITIVLLVLLVVALFYVISVFKNGKTEICEVQEGKVRFIYDGNNTDSDLAVADLNAIKHIFNNKYLYADHPSCGFSEDIAVYFDGESHIFCIARDGCPIIFYKSTNQYLRLTDEEYADLIGILGRYGVYFPCV